ncbi:MAG TPA: nucleotide exchange factor GrpE [Candidatus Thermoplasmatota archaeon]
MAKPRKSGEAPEAPPPEVTPRPTTPQEAAPHGGDAVPPEGAAPPAAPPAPQPAAPPAPDYEDLYLRALAELDNYRKVAARERRTLLDMAAEGVVRKLLEPADAFERAVGEVERVHELAPEALQPVLLRSVEGLRALQRQLDAVLSSEGVERVSPRGEAFDPQRHEAVARVERADAAEGTILDVVQVGYTLRGAILRAPRVVVSARPAVDDKKDIKEEENAWQK